MVNKGLGLLCFLFGAGCLIFCIGGLSEAHKVDNYRELLKESHQNTDNCLEDYTDTLLNYQKCVQVVEYCVDNCVCVTPPEAKRTGIQI